MFERLDGAMIAQALPESIRVSDRVRSEDGGASSSSGLASSACRKAGAAAPPRWLNSLVALSRTRNSSLPRSAISLATVFASGRGSGGSCVWRKGTACSGAAANAQTAAYALAASSSANAVQHASSWRCVSGLTCQRPSPRRPVMSHRRIVESPLPLATLRPSGANATLPTLP